MTESEDLIREFVVESLEGLDRLDQDLVDLEKDPLNSKKLASVFRAIHTIKGTCGFLGLPTLERVSHEGESLLSRLRDGDLVLDAPLTTVLLSLVDAIRDLLGCIERSGGADEGPEDYAALIAGLRALHAHCESSHEDPSAERAMASAASPAAASHPAPVLSDTPRQGAADSSLRVDVSVVDALMDLVGELGLARNQILQCTAHSEDLALVHAAQRLKVVTAALQEGVMKARMQPIGNVWSKFPRLVRDLAASCGKQVRLEMEGGDTDLDRGIVEAIKDPLTHIIRNSVDHGIESPGDRVGRGKRPEGTIGLRACHEGGQVTIEISDDGAGIATERVRQRAVARGLVSAEQAQRLSERDVARLIFLPGLSTAAAVTHVSGRGVGMDVVKTHIEKIGGTVDMQSVAGVGTTLRIRIPLTLAIIPALMVTSGCDRFAIPQANLLELVRLDGEETTGAVEHIGSAQFLRSRGTLLPLVHLRAALRLADPAIDDDGMTVVVMEADRRRFGLVVDAVHDTEEIVVKPLGTQLKGITAFAGATIMGDGTIALILDALGLGQMCRVVPERRPVAAHDDQVSPPAPESEDTSTLLVFHAAEHHRMALPLSRVVRLEEVPRYLVERSGQRLVVQYRGEILPLLSLAHYFHHVEPPADFLQVIVVSGRGQRVGLVVHRIVDIVQQVVVADVRQPRRGVSASSVVQEHVTDMLDLEAVIADADLCPIAAVA